MQRYWLGDEGPKDWCQHSGSDRLVVVIITFEVKVLSALKVHDEVSDVVKERRRNQLVTGVVVSRERGALQSVLELGDVLAVTFVAA